MTQVIDRARNGVDTQQLHDTLHAIQAEPTLGVFQFRAHNQWVDGAHNQSSIQVFYGAGEENLSRADAFTVDAGEPAVLLGTDTGPSPVEFLLHALAASLTTTLVYTATARKIKLTEVESILEGDMDVRGALGLAGEVRNGFTQIRVTFLVEGDAPDETLQELVEHAQVRSAVLDMISNGVPVEVSVV
jgi:uncharacterized OsmC-like protein